MTKAKYKYNAVKTESGNYKIVDEAGAPITNQEYSAVELFNYQRHDFNPFVSYPTDAPIEYIFSVTETAKWDDLKNYYAIELKGLFHFLYDIFSLLLFWFEVKRGKVERWKYITATGEFITKAVYDDTYPFVSGVAFVRIKNKWGVVDNTGKEIIPLKYDKVEFIFNFSEYGEMSNAAYIKVTLGKKFGIYSLKGAMLIEPTYTSLRSITWEAVSILQKNHSFGYGYLTESLAAGHLKSLPLNEMINRLPKRHFFLSFDNVEREVNYLFCEEDGDFKKTVFDSKEYHFDFDFMSVSYKTGTVTMTCADGNYEITSNGELTKHNRYSDW